MSSFQWNFGLHASSPQAIEIDQWLLTPQGDQWFLPNPTVHALGWLIPIQHERQIWIIYYSVQL